MKATIYHNPRCSKSRQTLALLTDAGVEVNVVQYLKEPISEQSLRTLLGLLGLDAKDVIRKGEKVFKEGNLREHLDDEDRLIKEMVANPVLIERPIVVVGNAAALGRPPENILPLIER